MFVAKRVMVAGGAGFLGSHLCESLLRQGLDVLCVDNYYCSTKSNLLHLRDDPRFEIMRHDVTFPLYDDMVRGLVLLMNDTPNDFTGPVNLGNPEECTILELARLVIAMTGSRSKIHCEPLPCDDPVRRKPDISLAGSAFGWGPSIFLRDGLADTIAYFDQALTNRTAAV